MSDDFEDIDFDAIGSSSAEPQISKVIPLPPLNDREVKRAKKRRRLLFWFRVFGFLSILGLIVALVGAVGAYFYLKPRYDLAQSFDLSELEDIEVASRILDRNGKELGRIFVQNRRPVTIEEVSDHFVNALLSAEDSRFYQHDGVDYWGILRAVYYSMRSKGINQGASTITQQLARQTFELKDRTISRKFTEIFLAQRIERRIGSKQKILELYMNRIYFGGGYYGIAAASEGYFGKEPDRLSLVEAATLADHSEPLSPFPTQLSRNFHQMEESRPCSNGGRRSYRYRHAGPDGEDPRADDCEGEYYREVGFCV